MKSELHLILNEIKRFECKPKISEIFLSAFAYANQEHFTAWVNFQSKNKDDILPSIDTVHGTTPEIAIRALYASIQKYFAKCPTCGKPNG